MLYQNLHITSNYATVQRVAGLLGTTNCRDMNSGYGLSLTFCLMLNFCASSHSIVLLTLKRLQYSEGVSRNYYHRKTKFPQLPQSKNSPPAKNKKKRKELLKFLSVQLKCASLSPVRCKRAALPINTYQ